jgi:hypothetical protein
VHARDISTCMFLGVHTHSLVCFYQATVENETLQLQPACNHCLPSSPVGARARPADTFMSHNPQKHRMGKKRQPLQLGHRQFQQLCSEPAALETLLQEPGR